MKYVLKGGTSICVLTPSMAEDTLQQAMDSVRDQRLSSDMELEHLIVFDGEKAWADAEYKFAWTPNSQITRTPFNTGSGGWYGHRILAAYPHLVNHDYILFLDADNWYDPEHVASLVNLCKTKNLDFTYSLRKVYEGDKFLDHDCCEAIGRWPIAWMPENQPQYLVDTSAYCFKREWLIRHCQIWHFGWGGDRHFFMNVMPSSNYDTSGLPTLNYRLPDMDKAYGGDREIFKKGNAMIQKRYNGFPWKKQ